MPAEFNATVVRRAGIAALCLTIGWTAVAAAQSQAPSAQTPGLQGTGPRVDVQTSPNGTLDVSGTDSNLQGENFRGSFGASRSQPGFGVTPSLPRSSIQVPFGAPNFGPSMPGTAAPDGVGNHVDEADLAAYPDLILPRFRGALGGSAQASQRQSPDRWRFRYFNGRWWFWQPPGAWLYWDGARWQAFAPRQ